MLTKPLKNLRRIPSILILGLLAMYRVLISPLLGPACRFEPTCSCYATESIRRHGAIRGSWLVLKRLGRCHPLSRYSGYDPVPPTPSLSSLKERE